MFMVVLLSCCWSCLAATTKVDRPTSSCVVLLVLIIGEGFVVSRRRSSGWLRERFPGESTRGIMMYTTMRSIQHAPDADSQAAGRPRRQGLTAGRGLPPTAPGRRPRRPLLGWLLMEHRHLGRSGLKVSEIAYGNWITHGSQVEEDAALACVARGAGRGHHHLRHRRRLREHQGRVGARQGAARRAARVAGDLHQGLLADRARRERPRPVPQAHHGVAHASLRRLQTDYVDLYQAHRFDHETPLEETLRAFDDLVRQGKVLYIGVSEWRAEEIAAALKIAGELGLDRIVSNQPQYNMIWRVIEAEVDPAVRARGHRPDRLVADRAGRADRQVPAGRRAAGRARAPPTSAGSRLHHPLPHRATS